MGTIPQKQLENNFKTDIWLHFTLKGDGVEWIDRELPIPTTLLHYNEKSYSIAWRIDGFFWTKKNQEYLNDAIVRFLFTFADLEPKRKNFIPNISRNTHYYDKTYTLKEFSRNLKSLKNKKKAPTRADNFEDYCFWAIKLYAEDLIRSYGVIPYEQLENFALENFKEKKDISTLRAKCRSIWNWYNDRDWDISTKKKPKKYLNNKEKYEATRSSRTKKLKDVNRSRRIETRKKIRELIFSENANDYKFKSSGEWNISKIAKELKMSRDTVRAYIVDITKT